MQVGMIGLGRMGADMVRRLLKSGHECADQLNVASGGWYEPNVTINETLRAQ